MMKKYLRDYGVYRHLKEMIQFRCYKLFVVDYFAGWADVGRGTITGEEIQF